MNQGRLVCSRLVCCGTLLLEGTQTVPTIYSTWERRINQAFVEFIGSKTISIAGTDENFSCVKHVVDNERWYYSHEWAYICVIYRDCRLLAYDNTLRLFIPALFVILKHSIKSCPESRILHLPTVVSYVPNMWMGRGNWRTCSTCFVWSMGLFCWEPLSVTVWSKA